MIEKVVAPRVRWLAGVDLLGEDELRAVCFTLAGIIGSWLGIQIAGLFR